MDPEPSPTSRVAPRGAETGTAWVCALVLVTALHLLSTSGTWWITDHGEILAIADGFLRTGRLNLENLGPGWEDWTRIAHTRGSEETRFLPLSVLTLTPFLALDHLFGFRDPSSFRFAHLQGHVFVGAGIAIVGSSLARMGRSASVVSLSVLALGLNWPVWMIARRIGPEPVLFALLALFAAGGLRSRAMALILLPWVHASGPLLGACGLLWLAVSAGTLRSRSMGLACAAWLLGIVSLALLWNLPIHGSPVLGGYERFRGDPFFTLRNPLWGTPAILGPVLLWTLPLFLLTLRAGAGVVREALVLLLPAAMFFGVFSSPEPERRLAPLIAVWALVVGARAASVAPQFGVTLAALSLASGVVGLSGDFVSTVETPAGLFSGPHLLWLRLAFVEGRPLLASAVTAILLGAVWVAASRSLRLILEPDRASCFKPHP